MKKFLSSLEDAYTRRVESMLEFAVNEFPPALGWPSAFATMIVGYALVSPYLIFRWVLLPRRWQP